MLAMELGKVVEVERGLEGVKGLFNIAGGLCIELDFSPAVECVDLELGVITGEAVIVNGKGAAVDLLEPPWAWVAMILFWLAFTEVALVLVAGNRPAEVVEAVGVVSGDPIVREI